MELIKRLEHIFQARGACSLVFRKMLTISAFSHYLESIEKSLTEKTWNTFVYFKSNA